MISGDPHLGTDVPLLLPGDPAPVGALLRIRGPVPRRALRRFLRELGAAPDAPTVVVDATPGAGDAAERPIVVGPGRVLARTLGVGRVTPHLTLDVDGRRVWEHHGLRRSHLPEPRVVAERARTLRAFRSTSATWTDESALDAAA